LILDNPGLILYNPGLILDNPGLILEYTYSTWVYACDTLRGRVMTSDPYFNPGLIPDNPGLIPEYTYSRVVRTGSVLTEYRYLIVK
jgi:hypothetical protein